MKDQQFSSRDRAELDCWLAEFAALRAEIGTRTRLGSTSLLGGVAAIGAILSAHLTAPKLSPPIILAIPVILPLLGFHALNQRLVIGDIGRYIREEITLAIRDLTGSPSVFNWEEYARSSKSPGREVTNILSKFVYAVPSYAVLIVTLVTGFEHTRNWEAHLPSVVLWLVGAAVTILWTAFRLILHGQWQKRPLK